jgi:hypothetical protein
VYPVTVCSETRPGVASATTRAYGFGTHIALPYDQYDQYDQAIQRTRAALKEQGFGVLTEIATPRPAWRRCSVRSAPRRSQVSPRRRLTPEDVAKLLSVSAKYHFEVVEPGGA